MGMGRLRALALAATLAVGTIIGGTVAHADFSAAIVSAEIVSAEIVSAEIVDYDLPLDQWGYTPATITIAPGSWVTWSNAGLEEHTVTALDGSFDSGILGPSEGFSLYFDQPGEFPYYCALHDWMQATLVVVSGAEFETPPAEPVLDEPALDQVELLPEGDPQV